MQENIMKARKTYSRIGMSYTLMYLGYLVLLLVVMALYKVITNGEYLMGHSLNLLDMAVRFVILYPLMYLMIRKLPKFDIPKNSLGIKEILACLPITYTIMYIANLLGAYINVYVGKTTGVGGVNPIVEFVSDLSPIEQIIIVAVLAPIFEEFLFRKFIIDRVIGYGEVAAMFVSGFMFGLFHGNFIQFVYATALGMFYAFIYMRTGKLFYTIILHMFLNGFSLFVTNVMMRGVNAPELQQYLNNGDVDGYMEYFTSHVEDYAAMIVMGFFVLAIVITGIVLMIVNRNKFVFESYAEEVEKDLRFRTVALNPGMLFFIIFFAITIILTQFGINWYDSLVNAIMRMI
ncbi:CPBP family intramembrane glutamic endopeptidase [Butyrivibrio proteoclasticus]|uniref:CPBP family intramembrane glutamic endopeptidase n=1 Tax=Butyrivibrio proteoclasticus TaxID=43305 RepID=UPI000478CECB|nr:type II CAAX endopeptidase family protein [Butyrivibrio proteoclasticus]